MKFKLRWLPLGALTVVVLVCGLSGLALGQGPVLTALPTPTPIPFTPDAAVSTNGSLPDLVVTGIKTEPAVPKVGQPTKILVTVKNNGAAGVGSGNNFLTDLYIDPPNPLVVDYHQLITPDLPWGLQWFWLPAGGSYDLSTTWVFTDVKTLPETGMRPATTSVANDLTTTRLYLGLGLAIFGGSMVGLGSAGLGLVLLIWLRYRSPR